MEELYPLLREVIDSGGEFRLYPKGTSMLPLLRAGKDSVTLVSSDKLSRFDIYLYRRTGGQFVLHRLINFEKDGSPVFCGDNQLALERGVPSQNIIARVNAFYREQKRVDISSFYYRIYVKLHCCMLLRKLRFLPRRIKHFLTK